MLKFFKKLAIEFYNNELLYMSNELSYKLLLSIFPLLIYLINILTFFGIKYQVFESSVVRALPDTVLVILKSFVSSVNTFAESNNFSSIMNITLLLAIWSGSSGFHSIIRGINKTYGVKDRRSFLFQRIISVFFVFMFSFTVVVTGIFIVFSDVISNFMIFVGLTQYNIDLYGILKLLFPSTLMLLNVMIIYKVSSYKHISFISTLPGAFVTVIAWILSSYAYNIYINNFSKYSAVYGVIGSFLIFILWINIIAIVLLLGSQINALLEDYFVTKS